MRTTYRQRQTRDGRRVQERRAPLRAGQALGKTFLLPEPNHVTARELAGSGEVSERFCFGWCDSDR